MPSVSPANALSARVMLATGLHAQPGVYALLLGSGVSRSAGISTGWEIVSHLVQKAAAAGNPDDAESHELAKADPEAWWAQHGDGDLGYSSLLAAVAPSSAARQGLLAEYFVATDEDRAEGLKVPTAGHHAIAELVKGGWIKVILTTNFDRLMEQALDALGVVPGHRSPRCNNRIDTNRPCCRDHRQTSRRLERPRVSQHRGRTEYLPTTLGRRPAASLQ